MIQRSLYDIANVAVLVSSLGITINVVQSLVTPAPRHADGTATVSDDRLLDVFIVRDVLVNEQAQCSPSESLDMPWR